jgi:hypothetical protein
MGSMHQQGVESHLPSTHVGLSYKIAASPGYRRLVSFSFHVTHLGELNRPDSLDCVHSINQGACLDMGERCLPHEHSFI